MASISFDVIISFANPPERISDSSSVRYKIITCVHEWQNVPITSRWGLLNRQLRMLLCPLASTVFVNHCVASSPVLCASDVGWCYLADTPLMQKRNPFITPTTDDKWQTLGQTMTKKHWNSYQFVLSFIFTANASSRE